jgi:hypothetical protein
MNYDLVVEFRERLIERYDPVTLVELLNIETEDLWDAFTDLILRNSEIAEELGIADLEGDAVD